MAKRKITVSIDDAMYSAHRLANRNASEYINTLLREKFIDSHHETLVNRVTNDVIDSLLENEVFIAEIRNRVRLTGVQSSGDTVSHKAPVETTVDYSTSQE